MFRKFDEVKEEQAKAREEILLRPTTKEVRDIYVSKEVFIQMQKHIDDKFDDLKHDMKKILTVLHKGNRE
jgi:hypothetical protein